MKEILTVNETQAGYLDNLIYLSKAVTSVDKILSQGYDAAQLTNEMNIPLILVDKEIRGMLAGAIIGYFNELVFPLNEKLEKTKNEPMREVITAILNEARTQKPEL